MTIFASMLEISTSYLSLLEAGERKIQPQIIDKINDVLIDLTPAEKQKLATIKECFETPKLDLERKHKKIISLISEYFYRLQNKIIDEIEKLKQEIINLINELNEKYGQNLGNLFQQQQA
jgi:transcriptional regulator with XRE-family HTH domain